MSVKGFLINGETVHYDYNALENAPNFNENDQTVYIWNVSTASASITPSNALSSLSAGLYLIDATGLQTGSYIRVNVREITNGPWVMAKVVKKGEAEYLYIPFDCKQIYMSIAPSQQTYSGTITITRIADINASKIPTRTMLIPKHGEVNISEDKIFPDKACINGGISAQGKRLAIGLFNLVGEFNVSLQDYTNYKFAVIIYNTDSQEYIARDSGWITSNSYTIYTDSNSSFGITLAKNNAENLVPSDVLLSGIKITAIGDYYEKIATTDQIQSITETVNDIKTVDLLTLNTNLKPGYDHLFIDNRDSKITIPHESLYHVRLSHKMGYNIIEGNVAKTSDNVYIVNHLIGGKFGPYFYHVDGVTDISDIAVSSVTWDWIEQNVRYNSVIPKYRTRPCTLEEFLRECRQQNLIPFVTSNSPEIIQITESIMGKNNYIAYNASRDNAPNAIIYHYLGLSSKDEILTYCKKIGRPFIYGMNNPGSFTDEELQDIVNTLHENGFWIGLSYADNLWYKYSYLGFDFNGMIRQTNRIESGNLYNLNTIFNFNQFEVVNGTENNGILTFSNNGTIRPSIADNVENVACMDLEISFSGTITLQAIGERLNNWTITSDGKIPFFTCIPILNGSPKFTIQCNSGTNIYDIKYKVSRI